MERAVLVGVCLDDGKDMERTMDELKALAYACEMETVAIVVQNLEQVNKALYIGTGKVYEVKETAENLDADIIVFDDALSPSQLRNLQKEIGKPILDRTTLILEIFSRRAKTREAKLQVEVAKLQYMLPRLVGLHEALSRQGGGAGLSNKGSGEKKLELDRRKIEHRITELKKELEEVSKERETQGKLRNSSGILKVALVGYTNAGKSTLMNHMVDRYLMDDTKKVLEKDMLFATLETTVRNIQPDKNFQFLKGGKSRTARNQDRFCCFACGELVFFILSHRKVIGFLCFQFLKKKINSVFEFFIVFSCLGSIDKFKQGGKVLLFLGRFVPDIPDQSAVIQALRLYPKIFARFFALALGIGDDGIDEL